MRIFFDRHVGNRPAARVNPTGKSKTALQRVPVRNPVMLRSGKVVEEIPLEKVRRMGWSRGGGREKKAFKLFDGVPLLFFFFFFFLFSSFIFSFNKKTLPRNGEKKSYSNSLHEKCFWRHFPSVLTLETFSAHFQTFSLD